MDFADLKKLYQHQKISIPNGQGGNTTKSAADWWLSHHDRRTYDGGVVFDPTGKAPATCWNLWSGFAVEPKPGDWSLMREHVRTVICGGNEEYFQYVIRWAALMFQRPTEPGEVVLVIRGLKGAGKGIFASALVKAWGAHGIHIRDARHLVGNFNAHLRDCVCLFADEAFFAGDKQHESALKGLVTERMIPVEPKFRDLTMAANMLHILMASNADWVVPATHDERRYAVFNATDNRIGDRKYFAAIVKQMDAGGLAAMIYDLLLMDLTDFEVRDVPQSEALADQKKHSMDHLDRWWMEVLERGFIWRSKHGIAEFSEWSEWASTELLNRSYLQWCAENRVMRPMSRIQLGMRMSALYQHERPRGQGIIGEVESATRTAGTSDSTMFLAEDLVIRADRPSGYRLDTLDQARDQFEAIRAVSGDWKAQP
jgi:hypothetical protein